MVTLVRRTPATQVGMFSVDGEEVEVSIEASIQPVGDKTRQVFPEGTFTNESRIIFVTGQVEIKIGDSIKDGYGNEFKIVQHLGDWRKLGNYQKFHAHKVKN